MLATLELPLSNINKVEILGGNKYYFIQVRGELRCSHYKNGSIILDSYFKAEVSKLRKGSNGTFFQPSEPHKVSVTSSFVCACLFCHTLKM